MDHQVATLVQQGGQHGVEEVMGDDRIVAGSIAVERDAVALFNQKASGAGSAPKQETARFCIEAGPADLRGVEASRDVALDHRDIRNGGSISGQERLARERQAEGQPVRRHTHP